MRVVLVVAIALALIAALYGDNAADAKAKLKNVSRTATVAESGRIDVDSAGAAITSGSYAFTNVGKIRRIDHLTITLTIGDGDTGPGEPKEDLLSLALDGIATGIALNGFHDSEADTQTISGAPTNATQILAALKADGQLIATIVDADPNGNLVTLPANADTTLVVKGKAKKH
jgi:hypothetical protein